jgi:hypothetical protein
MFSNSGVKKYAPSSCMHWLKACYLWAIPSCSKPFLRDTSVKRQIIVIKVAVVRGQAFDWWERAEVLLDELRELGWDSVDS